MRSVRVDSELEARLQRAAALEGSSISEFIRDAISERAERVLEGSTAERLADVIGSARAGGGVAAQSGKAMTELLAHAHRRRDAD